MATRMTSAATSGRSNAVKHDPVERFEGERDQGGDEFTATGDESPQPDPVSPTR